jgi:hypothetical protein
LQNSPLESSCVVVALIENYSDSKLLKGSPEKSQILSCDTAVTNERYVLVVTNGDKLRKICLVFISIPTNGHRSSTKLTLKLI